MQKFSNETIGEFLLISSAILFSLSFIGSRYAMVAAGSSIGPWTFNALHYTVSCVVLILLEPILRKHPLFKYTDSTEEENTLDKSTHFEIDSRADESNSQSKFLTILSSWTGVNVTRQMLIIIVIQDSSNFVASILLQIGLMTLNVGKAAFITSCYVVVVPFVECFLTLFQGQKFVCVSSKTWAEVGICIIGVYLISGCTGNTSCLSGLHETGEGYVMASVFFWVINIIICDEAGLNNDSIILTVGDFALVALLTLLFSFIFEWDSWTNPESILSSWKIILFVGFFEALAYLLSTVGQIYVRPSRSAIIYTSESLFSCVGGYLFLGETLTQPEVLGGILIMLSSLLTSLSFVVNDQAPESDELESISGEEGDMGPGGLCLSEISPHLPTHPNRRSRAGSISRYHLIRPQNARSQDRSRPIPIIQYKPHTTKSSLSRGDGGEMYHYGSLPTESNINAFSIQPRLFSSSQ